MEVAEVKEQCKSVVEYAPEIPVKMTYPIIQIEGLPVRVFGCDQRGMRSWETHLLRGTITEYGGDGKSIPGERDVRGFTPDTYYSTKKDEKVVFIHADEGCRPDLVSDYHGWRNSQITTYIYYIITNYGFIHNGYIAGSDIYYGLGDSIASGKNFQFTEETFLAGPAGIGSRKDSVGEHSPGVYTWRRETRDRNCNDYSRSGKLIPNPFPDYPKVPKLFIDVLSSVLDKNQKRFHELCGEYKEEKEMFFEENTKLKEHNEKLQQENALLAKRCEELSERLKEYTVY